MRRDFPKPRRKSPHLWKQKDSKENSDRPCEVSPSLLHSRLFLHLSYSPHLGILIKPSTKYSGLTFALGLHFLMLASRSCKMCVLNKCVCFSPVKSLSVSFSDPGRVPHDGQRKTFASPPALNLLTGLLHTLLCEGHRRYRSGHKG